MKTLSLALVSLVLLVCAGCRRTDVREMSVVLPGAVPPAAQAALRQKVTGALAKYDGVDKSSYSWSFAASETVLTLRYDSMKIAQSNIRYAIDESGVKVAFPEKKGTCAGY